MAKDVQPIISGSNASGKPSNTTTSISILAVQASNYMEEFRPIYVETLSPDKHLDKGIKPNDAYYKYLNQNGA
jgi:hypothetical protein